MNNNYDNILNNKNKKTKLDIISENNSKKPNYAIIDIILVVIIIIISYIVYYNTILSSKSITLNDLNIIYNKYSNIISNLNYNIKNNFTIDGNIDIKNNNENNKILFNLIKNNNNIKLDINNNSTYINYISLDEDSYVKINTISDNYIKTNNIFAYLNLYSNIKNNIYEYFNSASKYKKSFYMDGDMPIVRVDISLNKDDISKIINNDNISNNLDYNVNITLLNNAFTNNIISVKCVVINNKSNKRDVYLYDGNDIIHTNDKGYSSKYEINNDKENFVLKIYKKDVLYSVLNGNKDDNGYNYLYQIIDSIYNIKLNINNDNNKFNYLVNFNINTTKKKYNIDMNINSNYKNSGAFDIDKFESININSLSDNDKEKYNNIINDLFGFNIKNIFN